jgi:SHS2 domain-containing protein
LTLRASTPEERLVGVLEEVVFLLDADGVVPCRAHIEPVTGQDVRGVLTVVAFADIVPVGAAPKAITRHSLRLQRRGELWRCRVVVDV